jgi:hypothetical protein
VRQDKTVSGEWGMVAISVVALLHRLDRQNYPHGLIHLVDR